MIDSACRIVSTQGTFGTCRSNRCCTPRLSRLPSSSFASQHPWWWVRFRVALCASSSRSLRLPSSARDPTSSDSSASSGSTSGADCNECVTFWNNLRVKAGCNGNSTICDYVPWITTAECQQMIDAICAAGCESNPSSCAYVRFPPCCGVRHVADLKRRAGRMLRRLVLHRQQVQQHRRPEAPEPVSISLTPPPAQ